MSIAPGERVGGRGRRRAVARTAAAIAVLLVGPGGAAAEDPPRPPAPPVPESPKPEPRQDPEAVAALRRLAELAPSPFAEGARELRCTATLQTDFPYAIRCRVRWPSDGAPEVEVDAPTPLLRRADAERLRKQYERVVTLPFLVRATWEPWMWKSAEVVAERRGEDLAVWCSRPPAANRCELSIARDGLLREYRTMSTDGPQDPGAASVRTSFATTVSGNALSRLDFGVESGLRRTIEISHFESLHHVPLPRQIEHRSGDGRPKTFVLHDYFLDSRPVPGTSFAEARAGRMRRVDRRAESALFRWDSAVAGGTADTVPTATCRLEYATGRSPHRFRVSWRHGVLERCEPEVPEDERPALAIAAWGVAGILFPGLEDLFRPPSRRHTDCDASMAQSPSAPLVLESNFGDSPVRLRRIRLDVGGLPADAELVFRDRYPPCTMRWEWGPFRDKHIQVSDTVTRGDRRTVTRYDWYDVPGFPPLQRSVERTITGAPDEGVYTQRFSDWVIDGRPVPGTASAAPAPPPDAPK